MTHTETAPTAPNLSEVITIAKHAFDTLGAVVERLTDERDYLVARVATVADERDAARREVDRARRELRALLDERNEARRELREARAQLDQLAQVRNSADT